jgi:hypothetical protein
MGENNLISEILPSVHTVTVSSPPSMPSTATINQVTWYGGQQVPDDSAATMAESCRHLNKGMTLVVVGVGESTATDWASIEGVRSIFANETLLSSVESSRRSNYILRLSAPDWSKNVCFFDHEVFAWDLAHADEPVASEVFRVSPMTVDVETLIAPSESGPISQTEDMMRSLSSLTALAKLVLPDSRELLAKEKKNLQQYYKKLYRKV